MERPSNIKTRRANILGSTADILTVGVIYILTQIVLAVLILAVGLDTQEKLEQHPGIVVGFYILAGIATLGFTLLAMKLRKVSWSILNLKKFHYKDLLYALMGVAIYLFISGLVAQLLALIPGLNLDQKQDLGISNVDSGALLFLTFLSLAVVPPIVEEVLFRGYLYGCLKYHQVTPLLAALITSVGFGLVHGQWNVGIDTLLLSMVMIYMYEKRGSLWVTITMHALKNTIAFLALFVFKIS